MRHRATPLSRVRRSSPGVSPTRWPTRLACRTRAGFDDEETSRQPAGFELQDLGEHDARNENPGRAIGWDFKRIEDAGG